MANYSLKQTFVQFSKKILAWVKSNCVNNLVSDATNLPLAAAQGKKLQGEIDTLNSNLMFKQISLTDNGNGTYSCQYTEYATGLIYLGISTKFSYLYFSNAMWNYTVRKDISKNYIGDISSVSFKTTTGRGCEITITSSTKLTNLSVIAIGIN